MKSKTLIAALLIGISSMATVAAAQPSNGPDIYYRHHRRFERNPYYYPDRDRDTYDSSQGWIPPQTPGYGTYHSGSYDSERRGSWYDRRANGGWQPLVSSVVVANQRQFIHVSPELSLMRAVRLDATRGAFYVLAIGVFHVDGSVEK